MVEPAALPRTLQDLLALWTLKRGGRALPARRDFAFEELGPWLGQLHLIEVLDDGDFLIKVFAGRSASRMGIELTGKRLSQVEQNWVMRDAIEDYRRCVATAEPLFADRTRRHEDGRMWSWRRLILPLGHERTVDHLFVGMDYDFA